MKMYYKISGDFANAYHLIWADETNSDRVPRCAERITRRRALELASEERDRRKHDQAFSGYATDAVYPADYVGVMSYYDTPADRYLVPDGVEPRIINWRPDANRVACNRRCGIDY